MRILLAFYFMLNQATAQIAPPMVLPAQPNYILPSMQPTAPWGTNYGLGTQYQFRPPIYGGGLPMSYQLPPQYSFGGYPQSSYGFGGGYPQQPNAYGFGGGYPPQANAFGLGGPRFPTYPMGGPVLPQQQNSFAPLLALGLPLLSQLFGGGGGLGASASVGPLDSSFDDCETCRGLRSSPVVRRISPRPQPPEEESFSETEAAAPMSPSAAAVPAYQPAVLPTSTVTRSSAPVVDRVATVDETPAQNYAPASVAPTPAARPYVKPTAATTTTIVTPPRRAFTTTEVRATPAELNVVRARTRDEQRSQAAPVWNSFMHNFKICAPGCVPADYGTYGSRGNMSCHPSGRAIDVHKMVCGARTYTAIANQPEFRRMVQCMESAPGNRNKSQSAISTVKGLVAMRTLYQNKDPRRYGVTQAHYDHAHFSITCFNGRVW